MSLRLTWTNLTIAIALAVTAGLALSAVIGGDSEPRVISEPNSPSGGPRPMGLNAVESVEARGPDTLVMIQGLKARRVVVWSMMGSSLPLEVDAQVDPLRLWPDATGQRALYSVNRAVLALDVRARRAVIVGELPEGAHLASAQWSPDGSAVAYVAVRGARLLAYYGAADGGQPAVEIMSTQNGLGLDVAWLPDGRPVTIYKDTGLASNPSPRYQLYDPATGERSPLPPETRVIQPWSPWRSPDGAQQVYASRAWGDAHYRYQCQTGPLVVVGRDRLPLAITDDLSSYETLFELTGLTMDWPTWLRDGRVVFRGIADEACAFSESQPDTGLYISEVGRAPRALVTIPPPDAFDDSDTLLWSVSYAISPDQTRIAWTENDPDTGRSAIRIAPLDGSGPAETVFETPPVTDPAPFAYRDTVMILYFVWLP
jgi:dipeptidyl aminopeptidase/acylaminoacyl peptidase